MDEMRVWIVFLIGWIASVIFATTVLDYKQVRVLDENHMQIDGTFYRVEKVKLSGIPE